LLLVLKDGGTQSSSNVGVSDIQIQKQATWLVSEVPLGETHSDFPFLGLHCTGMVTCPVTVSVTIKFDKWLRLVRMTYSCESVMMMIIGIKAKMDF
jgi:hypothetical protein